jgi:hypothetical protein
MWPWRPARTFPTRPELLESPGQARSGRRAGAQGPPDLNWQGDWDSAIRYESDDAVQLDGNTLHRRRHAQYLYYGLCYQVGSTYLAWFVNYGSQSTTFFGGGDSHVLNAAGAVAPGAGTYQVGFCIRNNGSIALTSNDNVNGWVMVTG